MEIEDQALKTVARILLTCIVQFVVVLLLWWAVLTWFGDLAYRAHSSFVPISREQFNVIHYTGILVTKLALAFFFLAPYIAIRLELRRREKGQPNPPDAENGSSGLGSGPPSVR